MPSIAYHQLELIVTIDASAHVFIVVHELLQGNDSVSLNGVPLSHEFVQNLVGCFLARFEVGVEADIISYFHVFKVDSLVSVLVKLGIGKLH